MLAWMTAYTPFAPVAPARTLVGGADSLTPPWERPFSLCFAGPQPHWPLVQPI